MRTLPNPVFPPEPCKDSKADQKCVVWSLPACPGALRHSGGDPTMQRIATRIFVFSLVAVLALAAPSLADDFKVKQEYGQV